jgi:hypothetical protein
MRALIAVVVLVGLAGCGNGRGGRLVVVTPDEVPGRRGDSWNVTAEPSAGSTATREKPAR